MTRQAVEPTRHVADYRSDCSVVKQTVRALVGIAAAACSLAARGLAQAPDPMARLGGARTVRCEFSTMAVGDWKDGVAQTATRSATLSLRFESVDVDGGTAEAVGPFGPSEINVRVTGNALHFMQSFREGPLYLTTVIGRPTKDGRWPAVHTRHEYMDVSLPGYTSRPEQDDGSCAVAP